MTKVAKQGLTVGTFLILFVVVAIITIMLTRDHTRNRPCIPAVPRAIDGHCEHHQHILLIEQGAAICRCRETP